MHADWYYKRDHKVLGPFTAAEMLRLAAEARVLPQDFVGKTPSGPWIRLAFCEDELSNAAKPGSPPLASPAIEMGLRAEPPAGRLGTTKQQDRPAPSGGEFPGQGARTGKERLPRRATGQKRSEWIGRYWGILAGLAVLIVVNIAVFAFPPRNVTAERYQLVLELWSRTQQLARSSASAEEWTALLEEAHQILDPVVADLEKNANVRRQIDQHVLWMSRDYLLPTIQQCLTLAQQPNRQESAMMARIENCDSKLRSHIDAIERVLRRERNSRN